LSKKPYNEVKKVNSDAPPALNNIDQIQNYKARVTLSYLVDE
jgi:hypothetical protein